MPKISHPRRGSMQFWPRSRSKHALVRIHSWPSFTKAKPLGFICYKVGMTHVMVNDNRPKSMTKGESISFPTTIVECPPMKVAGAAVYKNSIYGPKKIATVMTPQLDKNLGRKFDLPKKSGKTLNQFTDVDDIRLLVISNPPISVDTKKPKMLEMALGGSITEKKAYVQSIFGKDILINDVFEAGTVVDVRGVSKGKGFQGTVKRFGVPIRSHKAEKTKRGIATLGSWKPKRVEFTVANSGKMGFHQRTEYNKHILKIGQNGQDVTPAGGINKYGLVQHSYLLLKGSVVGPQKRALVMTVARRPDLRLPKEAPEVTHISV